VTETSEQSRGQRMPRPARRAQLLESARSVFVAQGYHAAAMDDIAESAGVSKPVLYQHFPGKLDLYLALLDLACDDVIDGVRDALASTHDNRNRVDATTAAFFTYVADPAGAFRLVFESDLTNEPAVRERVDRVTRETTEAVSEVIADDTGLPPDSSHLLAASLVGLSQFGARYWLSSGSPLAQDDAARLAASLAWRGIRGFPRTTDTAPSEVHP
jgi:AcrR family transcriptional regulator